MNAGPNRLCEIIRYYDSADTEQCEGKPGDKSADAENFVEARQDIKWQPGMPSPDVIFAVFGAIFLRKKILPVIAARHTVGKDCLAD